MAFNIDYDPLTGVPFVQGALPPAEPASAPVVTPATQVAPRQEPPPRPAPTRTVPASPPGETPEAIEALREFQTALRSQHTAFQPQQQLSVLDMLRKRMANAMENEQAQRISDLGTALLASRSPNFFTALGEGFAAQETGARSRMDQLRQVAEAERQQRALDVEEARRQEEIRVREQDQQLNAPLRAAQTQQALAYADYLRSGRGRGELTPQNILRIGAEARRFALQQVREPTPNSPEAIADTPERARLRQEERARIERAYIQGQYALLGMEPPATAAGEPGAGAGAGGAAPDRVLPYTPPAPGAARTGPRIAPPQQ